MGYPNVNLFNIYSEQTLGEASAAVESVQYWSKSDNLDLKLFC